jgi:hypothetical protein
MSRYQDHFAKWHRTRKGAESRCFSSPQFPRPKIDGCVFWDQNLCIVFDAYSPISSSCIGQIKKSSIIFNHVIFVIFFLPSPNIRVLHGKVISSERAARCDADRDTSFLFANALPSCDENQNGVPWELFATHCCLYWKSNGLSFFHI